MMKFSLSRNLPLIRSFGNAYHISQGYATSSSPSDLDPSKLLIIRKTGDSTPMPALPDLKFGQFFSDHLLDLDWDKINGWNRPVIRPTGTIQLHPAASCLHYGLEVFEGLKAFKDAAGTTRIFRGDMNMKRLNISAARMALPTFDEVALLRLIAKLLEVDDFFIPKEVGYSMYIRPCLFSTHPTVGVLPPDCAKMIVLLSPVGPYYRTGLKPIKLLAEDRYTRAFPGGVGDCKVGGNYGPTIMPQIEANEKGCSGIMWLYPVMSEGKQDYLLTEIGTMNLFVYWINEQGERELATCSLDKNLILPGVTRDSILNIVRGWKDVRVSERDILLKKDLLKGLQEKRVLEVFGAGTAAVISPVNGIHYNGMDYAVPLNPNDPNGGSGPFAKRVLTAITDIQYGRVESQWSVPLSKLL